MVTVEYSSNNSGGSWWLSDEDWYALEAAGWDVKWVKDEADRTWKDEGGERWLGALAKEASIEVENPQDAINSWQLATSQNPNDEGCNCCGQPHYFSYRNEDGSYGGSYYVEFGPVSSGWS